jgi:hypothetical protein
MSLKEGTDYHFDVRLHSHFRFPDNFLHQLSRFCHPNQGISTEFDGKVILDAMGRGIFSVPKAAGSLYKPNTELTNV